MASKPQKTVDEYIAAFPDDVQTVLQAMRETIRQALPERATEAMRYNLATFRLDGHDFIHYAGWKKHVSLYPVTDEVRSAIPELADYKSSGVTVHFPHSKPLPTKLIGKIVELHLSRGGPEGRHPPDRGAAQTDVKALEAESIVRSICNSLPETEERLSHGHPAWFVRGKKQFATYYARHHGETKPHIWCAAPPGAQEALVAAQPEVYFRPKYVGHRGWLGVYLDGGIDRQTLEGLLTEAFLAVSPASLRARFGAQ